MKYSFKTGNILGLVGGLVAVVGVFLPWMTATETITNTSTSASGISVPLFGILVLLFSALGLVLVLVGKRGACIGAMIMGILAFVFGLIVATVWSAIISTFGAGDILSIGYGLYMSLAGSIILVIGSVLTLGELKQIAPQMAPPPMFEQPMQ